MWICLPKVLPAPARGDAGPPIEAPLARSHARKPAATSSARRGGAVRGVVAARLSARSGSRTESRRVSHVLQLCCSADQGRRRGGGFRGVGRVGSCSGEARGGDGGAAPSCGRGPLRVGARGPARRRRRRRDGRRGTVAPLARRVACFGRSRKSPLRWRREGKPLRFRRRLAARRRRAPRPRSDAAAPPRPRRGPEDGQRRRAVRDLARREQRRSEDGGAARRRRRGRGAARLARQVGAVDGMLERPP
mmetsp:Transcript_1837/g.6555  ORF Transcript_1837/g.6555 Transcript_1837/m.6555 type:complete len:248 (-) Transcript_1837:553-1296(-)